MHTQAHESEKGDLRRLGQVLDETPAFWPAVFMGDSEQSVPVWPAQRPRNSDAARVCTNVPPIQCRGNAVIVRASPIIRA